MCEIVAIFVSSVFNCGHFWFPCVYLFCRLIQSVNGSVLISTSDTTLSLLLTGYFDVVLKTESIFLELGNYIFKYWLNKLYWYCMVFINVLYLPVISLLSTKPMISHREHFSLTCVCIHMYNGNWHSFFFGKK